MTSAQKSDWKTMPAPNKSEELGYEAVFTDSDMDILKTGLVPEQMEDKWFIYFQDNELYLHRSWTGALIYWLKFDGCPAGIRVAGSWVSRDPEEYKEEDILYDREMIDFLIRRLLLDQPVDFPTRGDSMPAGIEQHSAVGRAFPEKKFRSDHKLSLFQRLCNLFKTKQ